MHRRFHLAFVLAAVWLMIAVAASHAASPQTTDRNLNSRDSLRNSALVFRETKKGHVAFIGGSITEMNGYRPIICKALQAKFPDTKFTFTDAGIASTCSTTGAHRIEEDVFSKGPVDLFFIEFAVNDDQDARHARREAVRGLEGIIRHCRRHNPKMDIVVTHFVNEGMLATFAKNQVPVSIAAHEAVCEHYGIASVNLAREASQLIGEGKLTWKAYGGVHPGPDGNALAAQLCLQLLDNSWRQPANAASDYRLPDKPLDDGHYAEGRFLDLKEAKLGDGWTLGVPDWKKIPGGFRDRFGGKPFLVSMTPGSEASVAFEGQAIGVYVLAGPDAGMLEVKIDQGVWTKVNLLHAYSRGLHYPRTVMLATDLPRGKHMLMMRISSDRDPASKGTAVRILKFAVN